MFKKAIVATAVLAASTGFAFANGGSFHQEPHATHSAYVGVAVSRDFFTIRNKNDNLDLGDDGWNGELNAGLGWVFQDHYYLGAEIFGTVSSAKINLRSDQVEYKYSYGIDFVPGIKLSDSTMLYGKVGYVRGEFDGRFTDLATGRRFSDNRGRNGLQLGLGFETMLTNNVSAKLEYDWNYYDKFSKTDARPEVDSVKLGVAYHFMAA